MSDPYLYVTVAAAALAALAMVVSAGLAGWRGWLQLKADELTRRPLPAGDGAGAHAGPNAGQRIEIADLKERIRKLEAIAAGVEL